MIYAAYVALALVAFLVALNGFLRGAKKDQIDALLSLLLVGFIIIAFSVGGWKPGLLAVVIAFISATVTRPLAARLASSLSAVSTNDDGGYVGLPPRLIQEISQELGKPSDPDTILKEILGSDDRRDRAESALLDFCDQQPTLQALFREFEISRQDLEELYHQLLVAGAGQWICGHWVAASALAYPDSLRYVLMRRKENTQETAYNLIMYFERGAALDTISS